MRTLTKSLAVGCLLGGFGFACAAPPTTDSPPATGPTLVLALAALGSEDGKPKPLPARVGILSQSDQGWSYRYLEDPDSNVFHKAMAYSSADGPTHQGLLTLGGSKAAVKLWSKDGETQTLWEEDFGGRFSRMRDAEVGDIYGDGSAAIAVATHDQGVVAVLRPNAGGGFDIDKLDHAAKTIVHEIELGDLDGDGVLEIYATPSAPNKVDGTPQPGTVVKYVPANSEGRQVVADLGERHAKEILVADIDADGTDELYVSVEAISGGKVEIRRYDADTDPAAGTVVVELDDKLCRFLTAGDVDGDGQQEIVAATHKKGLWLIRHNEEGWHTELIDSNSGGFEHASILLDLDEDGRDELYVASDTQKQVRRYDWSSTGWKTEVLLEHTDDLGRFTWNIMVVPAEFLPTE